MDKRTIKIRLILPSLVQIPQEVLAELRVEDLGLADAPPVALGRASVRTRLPVGGEHLDLDVEVHRLSQATMPTVWARISPAAALGAAIAPGDLITAVGTDPRDVDSDGICRVRLTLAT